MRGDVDETTSDLIERAVHLAASRDTGGTGTGTDSGTDSDTDTDTRTDTSTGSGSGPVDGPLGAFLYRYYRHVAADDLAGRDAAELLGAAISQRELAKRRPQGTSTVRVFSPTVGEHGWDAGHSIVEVVTDDMPFLVDSVTAELSRHGCGIHLVIHPQFVVRRDMVGTLIEVLDLDPALAPAEPDLVVESWIHVEIDRQDDPDRTAILAADLQRVLRDVRETVEDWAKMRAAAGRVADELESDPPAGLPTGEVTEGAALLRWLAEDHFTFLGYREYVLRHDDGGDVLQSVPGTGLGILRSDKLISVSFAKLSPQVRAKAHDKALLILTKANSRATVHRPAYLDYIGVRRFDAAGNPVGERRFLGLFNRAAYAESVRRTPVVREKVAAVLDRLGFSRVSHSGKDLIRILETYPRDELFQISVDDLAPTAVGVLHLQERRQLRLFVRRDDYGRFLSCLVYLPRDRYTTAVRERLQAILLASLGGASVEYTAYVTESVLARLHFVVRMPAGGPLPDLDVPEVERRLADATRSWDEDLVDAIHSHYGEADASSAITRYGRTFPEAYKEDFPARTGVADVRRLESLGGDGELGLNLYEPYLAEPGEHRFKVYRTGTPLSLSAVLPVLQHLGVDVVDERPYEIERAGTSPAWVYDFGLRYDPAVLVESPGVKRRFEEAFAAIWAGDAEDDGFNALVLRGLEWRQVVVLRAYVKHLRQIGSAFSQDYIQSSVLANVGIARLLIELFDARFDPSGAVDPDERERQSSAVAERVLVALDEVASLDEDRILRSLLIEIQATIRTNVFQRTPEGTPKPYVSLKLDPQRIPDLPRPRPRFEIWVYSPRVEGVHLRFGPVARGGLRWSDRREDFRTEVLGLVKAQTVKNAVIVPVGAKGGFVVKRPGDPADREAQLSEGIACYRTFIRGLLDVTDNLVAGVAVPPPDVVRHDGDDAYLVVAADKGTASFSDIANEIALEYGFWLGDAFASGGSAGYDHKTMGITARGAWESVQRHFRELGTDPTTTGFSVVGIGDMSGDVFGNGMLLSEHIRLVAAFDHRHLFLDPDPDPLRALAERRRLFALPRSSWADYDASAISLGGGVYPRSAKAVPVSAQVREVLGIDSAAPTLTPAELLRAILLAPVDLLWNGGIGTYVKASTESHADVGDKANDAIRVNGADLRCRVVGEGGNLGCTQLGRIEYALAGGRINTDAIDNSAGVDTSDHEVNIKILLDRVVHAGELTTKQRNALLAEMTDEVAALVLRDNFDQNVALALSRAQAASLLHVHASYLSALEDGGHLDRALEFLPSDAVIAERRAAGQGLTSPEFAVLLAYAKITLTEEVVGSELPDEPYLHGVLERYFPTPLRERFATQMATHPLRREILATCLVNDMVNTAGTTFAYRLGGETAAPVAEIVRAHMAAAQMFGIPALTAAIEALDATVATAPQTAALLDARRLAERGSRWLLQHRRPPIVVPATVAHFAPGLDTLLPLLPKLVVGSDRAAYDERRGGLLAAGMPEQLADRIAILDTAYSSLDIVEVAALFGLGVETAAAVYFDLGDRLEISQLHERIFALPRDDRWRTMARAALREDLYAAHAGLTADVLRSTDPAASAEVRIAAWVAANAAAVARVEQTLVEVLAAGSFDLATLSVALRAIRSIVAASGGPGAAG